MMFRVYRIWTLKARCTQYGFCEHGNLQEYKGNFSLKLSGTGKNFEVGLNISEVGIEI
jgi:hypothetical protein